MASQQQQPAKRTFADESGKYHLPNDTEEHERLDMQSAALVALMNHKPFHAPLSNPKRILDVGCGTGAMTMMLASLYPDAEVIGVDISPGPESRHGKLPNIEYVQGDIFDLATDGKDGRSAPASFDYVFHRLLILGMTDWPGYVTMTAKLVRPGGWLEAHEPSTELRSSSAKNELARHAWYLQFREDAELVGLEIEVGSKLAAIYQATPGLTRVAEASYPYAPAPRAEVPELVPLESSIRNLWRLFMHKISGPRRAKDVMDKMNSDFESTWAHLTGEERFRTYSVIAQKQPDEL